jgi:hypothetical protein
MRFAADITSREGSPSDLSPDHRRGKISIWGPLFSLAWLEEAGKLEVRCHSWRPVRPKSIVAGRRAEHSGSARSYAH